MTRQTRIYGGYIQKLDVPGWALNPWQHYTQQQKHATCRTPGKNSVSSADMSWAANHLAAWECCFVLIEQWIHIFWHQVLARHPSPCDFFSPLKSLTVRTTEGLSKISASTLHQTRVNLCIIHMIYMILPSNSKTSLNSRHYSNQKNLPLLGSIGHPKPSIYNYQHQVVKPQVHSDLVQVLPAPNRTIRSGSHGQWLRIDTTCVNRVYLIMVMLVKTESLP